LIFPALESLALYFLRATSEIKFESCRELFSHADTREMPRIIKHNLLGSLINFTTTDVNATITELHLLFISRHPRAGPAASEDTRFDDPIDARSQLHLHEPAQREDDEEP
jgi:hypothetical protein